MDKLTEVKQKQQQLSTRIITTAIEQHIIEKYRSASKRLIFLDYDGTLVPFQADPLKALPDPALLKLLRPLYLDPKNKVVIISGRKKETLEQWLGSLPVDIIAEHGAWTRENGQDWVLANDLVGKNWKPDFYPLLKQYELQTPGSFIEEKDYSLAWHFRKVEAGLGELRVREITGNLKYAAANAGLQLLEGNKVLEIKSANINKGNAAQQWLKQDEPDFILAIGDDQTDEDTFIAMPPEAFTIKVGTGISTATYFLRNPAEVRNLLIQLAQDPDGKAVNEENSGALINH